MNPKLFFTVPLTTFLAIFLVIVSLKPLWAGEQLDWDIGAATTLGYNDNISLSDQNEKNDITNTTVVSLKADQEGKTHQLSAKASIIQNLFLDHSEFNNTAEHADLNFKKELSAYDRYSLSNNFVHAEDPTNFDDAFTSESGRYSYFRNRFGFIYDKDFSQNFAGQFNYGNEIYEVSRDDLSDSQLNSVGSEVYWKRNSATMFLLAYGFMHRDYNPGGSIQVHTIEGGVEQKLSAKSTLEARLGTALADDGTNDSTNLKALIKFIHQISENETITFAFVNQSIPTNSNSGVFESWRASADLNKRMSQRWIGKLSLFYGEGEYETTDIEESLSGINSRLEYELTRHVNTFISYNFSNKGSNVSSREYTQNVYLIGIDMKF